VAAWTPLAVQAEDANAAKKESVQFDGQRLILSYTVEKADQSLREFIPENEKLESWTKLASIREYSKLDDPKKLAIKLLENLKQNNPDAPSRMIVNSKTGEAVIDFVTWAPDNSFIEFNVFKYRRKHGGGLVAEQFAVRDYKDPEGFLKGLKPLRTRLVEAMAKDGLQVAK
jgi:hypothetical protein